MQTRKGSGRHDGIVISRVEASSVAASKKKHKIKAKKIYRKAKGGEKEGGVEEETSGEEKASLEKIDLTYYFEPSDAREWLGYRRSKKLQTVTGMSR